MIEDQGWKDEGSSKEEEVERKEILVDAISNDFFSPSSTRCDVSTLWSKVRMALHHTSSSLPVLYLKPATSF